ncbi:MAG: inositol-3-phosphate synthase [Syntrophaceae bacterium]|nr:inositol-3-phosphate synthase [Syntrophaceae bacterium]
MKPPLLLVAGAKGAVGSTVAAAVADLRNKGGNCIPWLTTNAWNREEIFCQTTFAGWDLSGKSMTEILAEQGIVAADRFAVCTEDLNGMLVRCPPGFDLTLQKQVQHLVADIREFKMIFPDHQAVFINLLPACEIHDLSQYSNLEAIYDRCDPCSFPDLAYTLAALETCVPIVNFTSNALEMPLLLQEAVKSDIPWCGRDGKTGQTYLKVVIASALKARNLMLDGWYSVNILGNEDGRNLANPSKASGKLANKTDFLDSILGYQVGQRYGQSTHKVAIDYYPPRGDCKEAWDVIDFTGVFGMPMSLRLNMQLRDSILAAPMVIDLAVWMAALTAAGRTGFVPELAFYFKKAPLPESPVNFQEQIGAMQHMAQNLLETLTF